MEQLNAQCNQGRRAGGDYTMITQKEDSRSQLAEERRSAMEPFSSISGPGDKSSDAMQRCMTRARRHREPLDEERLSDSAAVSSCGGP
eukprot:747457-Hanusia_phi.AAC.1